LQSAIFTTEITVENVVWKRPDELVIPGVSTPTLGQLFTVMDDVSVKLGTLSNSLELLHGALSSDPVEQLDTVSGILGLGAQFSPPGVSDVIDMYQQMVTLTQDKLTGLSHQLTENHVDHIIDNLPTLDQPNNVLLDLGGLNGGSDVLFSTSWLKHYSDYFDSLL